MLSAAFAENTNCFPKILLILLIVHCNSIYTVYETQIEWLKTRTFGDVATLRRENYRVLFRPVFLASFLRPAWRYLTAMCRLGWGNFCAFDWNGLPVSREFDGKFLKNVKSPPHALPPPPPPPTGIKLIGALYRIGLSVDIFLQKGKS